MMTEIVEKYAAMIGLSAPDQAAFREMAAKTEPEPEFWAILQTYAEGKRAPIDFLGDLKALAASKGWDEYLFLGTVILFLYEQEHQHYADEFAGRVLGHRILELLHPGEKPGDIEHGRKQSHRQYKIDHFILRRECYKDKPDDNADC